MDENLQDGVTAKNAAVDTGVAGIGLDGDTKATSQDGQNPPNGAAPENGDKPDIKLIEVSESDLNAFAARETELENKLSVAQGDRQTAMDQANFATQQLKNLSQGNFQQAPSNKQAAPGVFDDIKDEDVIDGAQAKAMFAKGLDAAMAPVMQRIDGLTIAVQNPNAMEDMKNKLPELLKTNPDLIDVIKTSSNPLATAAAFLKVAGTNKATEPKIDPVIGTPADTSKAMLKKILDNSEKSGSPSSVGGGGGGAESASKISNMTDAEFAQYRESVKAGNIKIGA